MRLIAWVERMRYLAVRACASHASHACLTYMHGERMCESMCGRGLCFAAALGMELPDI